MSRFEKTLFIALCPLWMVLTGLIYRGINYLHGDINATPSQNQPYTQQLACSPQSDSHSANPKS